MRLFLTLFTLLSLVACDSKRTSPPAQVEAAPAVKTLLPPDITHSVMRVNATQQAWSVGQPWEKNPPELRRALAAIVGPQQVLTTSDLVANATYLEFETPNGNFLAQAKVLAVDYEANLALLGPITEAEGSVIFKDTLPLAIVAPPTIGEQLEILQIEDNGHQLITPGVLQTIDVTSNFLPDHGFLTYSVKASMQSAASSYSLPVLQNGKLAGILTNYNDKEQICSVAAVDIINRFLLESKQRPYQGFPSFGVSIARSEDPSFRQWLKLNDEQGGIYVHSVRKESPAALAGVKEGDVILTVDGQAIDRRGYYEHSHYGRLYWAHLVRGSRSTGDSIPLEILRAGEVLRMTAILTREEESSQLIPGHNFGQAPNFLVKGGFVFQELSQALLESYGDNWETRAPLNFLDARQNPENYEDSVERIIFLSGSIPTPATVGYETLRNLMVRRVNGKEIKTMKDLIAAFSSHTETLHSIEFVEENFTVYLDEAVCKVVDGQLLKRGISPLSRSN